MKLAGAITEGSGAINEDGMGYLGSAEAISAAWIFDGVTGINGRNYLPGGNDARWMVSFAHDQLVQLAASDLPLAIILEKLVAALVAEWARVSGSIELPDSYDPPAACLVLVKRYGNSWQGLRLGDSCLLASYAGGNHQAIAASPNNVFDHWLSREAKKRRAAGVLDIKALLAEFRPQLLASRKSRNTAGGYSILEASTNALRQPEYIDLGNPATMLLCTDGYYRAVDHYGLHDEQSLLRASRSNGGVAAVLRDIRQTEADDPHCDRFLRFKPADDATALCLID